ncbi:hypothetical protein GCM10010412_098440 [Nonomuraea recticatena]|uniref:Serine/threonine protein kinase n=1 Tax=Nonomuraea recticatena TaxID=46178 RepID=A0ABP6FW15_9ACTN
MAHRLRASFRYAAGQRWDGIIKVLTSIYTVPTEAAALERFYAFAETSGGRHPSIVKLWEEEVWIELVPFLQL